MKKIQNDLDESRRDFLQKSMYIAPAIVMLGSLNVHAGKPGASALKENKGNNGFGNGDQDAPGNSLGNNGAENDTNAKKKVNHVGVDTQGGHEKDIVDK